MIEAIYLALRAGLSQGLATVFGASLAATVLGSVGVMACLRRRAKGSENVDRTRAG
jgi:hypothetical protein